MILKHRSSPSIRQNKLKQCYDDIGINIEINVKAVSIHQHSQNAMKSKLFAIASVRTLLQLIICSRPLLENTCLVNHQ